MQTDMNATQKETEHVAKMYYWRSNNTSHFAEQMLHDDGKVA